jgi:hypothetical protein
MSNGTYNPGSASPRNWNPRNWGIAQNSGSPCAALVILALILYVIDWLWLGFNGINVSIFFRRISFGIFSAQVPSLQGFDLAGILVNPIILVYIIFYLLTHRPVVDPNNFFSRLGLIWVCSAILFLGGFSGSGLFHLGFAFILYFWLLRPYYSDDIPKAERIIAGLLLVDFFVYGILQSLYSGNAIIIQYLTNRFIFPLWFLYTLYKCQQVTGKGWLNGVLFSVILVYLFYFGYVWFHVYNLSSTVPPEQREEAKNFITTAKENFQNWVGELFRDIKTSAEQQLEYATGGYYNGQVEQNQDPRNQLGVHLENVEAADREFFENEAVTVWGDIKARTLDDPIYIYMGCSSGDVKGRIVPEALANPEYLTNPKKGYAIEQLEEMGFECRFDGGQLKTGVNTINIKVEFSFTTLAYLKTYFMDIERIRTLRRDNLDPLAEYGITDKTPTAVFTNGPVRLGMGTTDPPLGISADTDTYSYIGVTVEGQWVGQIKNVTDVTFQVPKSFKLEPEGSDVVCREEFEKDSETDDGYTVYKITKKGLENIKTPISTFKSWRCSTKISRGTGVLGNTPVTTYYYRASADYIYEIQKSVNVNIKGIPGEKTKLSGCDVVCTDTDGCICPANCKVAEGDAIAQDSTCNNYAAAPSNTGRTVQEDLDFVTADMQYITGMIALNERCLEGNIDIIKESIDNSDLSDEEKAQLKSDPVLVEGCQERSYRFFEITEGLIVQKVNDIVGIFKVLDGKELGDSLATANSKKTEASNLLGRIIQHFRDNYDYVITENNDANIKTVELKKQELDNIVL